MLIYEGRFPHGEAALVPLATDISKSFFVIYNVLETRSVEIDHVGVSYQFGQSLRRYLHERLEEWDVCLEAPHPIRVCLVCI